MPYFEYIDWIFDREMYRLFTFTWMLVDVSLHLKLSQRAHQITQYEDEGEISILT